MATLVRFTETSTRPSLPAPGAVRRKRRSLIERTADADCGLPAVRLPGKWRSKTFAAVRAGSYQRLFVTKAVPFQYCVCIGIGICDQLRAMRVLQAQAAITPSLPARRLRRRTRFRAAPSKSAGARSENRAVPATALSEASAALIVKAMLALKGGAGTALLRLNATVSPALTVNRPGAGDPGVGVTVGRIERKVVSGITGVLRTQPTRPRN